MFSKTSIAAVLPQFIDKSMLALEKLESAAVSKTPIDIQDLFFRFTLDAMGEAGFGHSIDSLNRYLLFFLRCKLEWEVSWGVPSCCVGGVGGREDSIIQQC